MSRKIIKITSDIYEGKDLRDGESGYLFSGNDTIDPTGKMVYFIADKPNEKNTYSWSCASGGYENHFKIMSTYPITKKLRSTIFDAIFNGEISTYIGMDLTCSKEIYNTFKMYLK